MLMGEVKGWSNEALIRVLSEQLEVCKIAEKSGKQAWSKGLRRKTTHREDAEEGKSKTYSERAKIMPRREQEVTI